MNKKHLLFLSLFGFATSVYSATPTGTEIMTQNEDRRKIDEVFSKASLTTGGGGSPERIKQFSWWRKLTGDQIHFNTLTRFHLPAEIRGEGILFLERNNNENEILMYLPNFKKIRRVESQQQSGSFMGSELSYSDIATAHVGDYKQKLLREENCPGEKNADVKCYVVESTPVSESILERTGYGKTVSWIRQDNLMASQAEYYNPEGELKKKMEASEIRVVDKTKNKWMAHFLRVENVKTGRFTLLQFSNVKVNQGIPDSTFSQQNLSRAQ